MIGNSGNSFSTNSNDPGVPSTAYAVFTPSTNTNVKIRLTTISAHVATNNDVGQISIIQMTAQGPSGATGPAGPNSNTAWDNDIRLSLSNAVYAAPPLTNPLDINNYVHEVHIDMVLSGNPSSWVNMGFNEYFTTSAYDANHYAINWGVFDSDSASGTFGGYNHNPYVNFVYCDVGGNISIRMFVEANRQLGQGRLGVVARGSWDLVDRPLNDQSTITNSQKQIFTKYQYGAPLMTSAYPNGTLADINYISIGTNGSSVLQRFRIKTKKHALSSD
jgi:hypothetical protein